MKTMGPLSELRTTEHMKTELTQHTKSFQSFCALGRALFTGCCILGNYYARKPFYKCKTSVCSMSFSLKYFYGVLDTFKSKGTQPFVIFLQAPMSIIQQVMLREYFPPTSSQSK